MLTTYARTLHETGKGIISAFQPP